MVKMVVPQEYFFSVLVYKGFDGPYQLQYAAAWHNKNCLPLDLKPGLPSSLSAALPSVLSHRGSNNKFINFIFWTELMKFALLHQKLCNKIRKYQPKYLSLPFMSGQVKNS